MGPCRHCRACAQLARARAVPAGRPACGRARRDRVCPRAGAGRLGHRYYHQGRFERPTNLPTTTIVESGPYRFTRNPIYLGMFLGLIGLAIAFDNLWLLMMLLPFALVIHYGVVAREEAHLERKFGDAYRGYRSRVRRWL
jgi:protein-S-isoprenylcysteine O-methyltransferase Ste14